MLPLNINWAAFLIGGFTAAIMATIDLRTKHGSYPFGMKAAVALWASICLLDGLVGGFVAHNTDWLRPPNSNAPVLNGILAWTIAGMTGSIILRARWKTVHVHGESQARGPTFIYDHVRGQCEKPLRNHLWVIKRRREEAQKQRLMSILDYVNISLDEVLEEIDLYLENREIPPKVKTEAEREMRKARQESDPTEAKRLLVTALLRLEITAPLESLLDRERPTEAGAAR
jgi:hypothetical protein